MQIVALNCFTTAFTQLCSAIQPFHHKSVNVKECKLSLSTNSVKTLNGCTQTDK